MFQDYSDVPRFLKDMRSGILRALAPFSVWHKWAALVRGTGACMEWFRYTFVMPDRAVLFFIVSCERNAGEAALKCLESVHRQHAVNLRHLFVDDASTDGTDKLVREWLKEHPDHRVEYVRREKRRGGTRNTVEGFRAAPPGSIVVELNGDDWLPDAGTLAFLSKVYRDRNVWMTCNTMRRSDGAVYRRAAAARALINKGWAVRDYPHWITSALQTFRRELFDHVAEENLLDPATGEYWESADDVAIYMSLLELAGRHARHIHRITYIYNCRDTSHVMAERHETTAREQRIRASAKHTPLRELGGP